MAFSPCENDYELDKAVRDNNIWKHSKTNKN